MSSIQDVLAELQRNYLASMPEKITGIEGLWKSGDIDKLETEYHKLKGTGRTYGLPEVSQLGEALERLCEAERATLDRAVPLSLNLLAMIRDKRVKGEVPNIEETDEFKTIVRLIGEMK